MKRKIDCIAVELSAENVEKSKTEERRVIKNGSTFLVILKKNEFPYAKSVKWIKKKIGYE